MKGNKNKTQNWKSDLWNNVPFKFQEAIKVRFKKITPIPDIAHIEALCSLLESLVTIQLSKLQL